MVRQRIRSQLGEDVARRGRHQGRPLIEQIGGPVRVLRGEPGAKLGGRQGVELKPAVEGRHEAQSTSQGAILDHQRGGRVRMPGRPPKGDDPAERVTHDEGATHPKRLQHALKIPDIIVVQIASFGFRRRAMSTHVDGNRRELGGQLGNDRIPGRAGTADPVNQEDPGAITFPFPDRDPVPVEVDLFGS